MYDYYLLAFLLSDTYLFSMWHKGTNLSVLFVKDFTIHSPCDCRGLTCLPASDSVRLLESNNYCHLPTAYLFQAFVSKCIHTDYLPAVQSENNFHELKGKGRLRHTLLICSCGVGRDMPFIVQMNDQITTLVQFNEINSS